MHHYPNAVEEYISKPFGIASVDTGISKDSYQSRVGHGGV